MNHKLAAARLCGTDGAAVHAHLRLGEIKSSTCRYAYLPFTISIPVRPVTQCSCRRMFISMNQKFPFRSAEPRSGAPTSRLTAATAASDCRPASCQLRRVSSSSDCAAVWNSPVAETYHISMLVG